MTHEEWLRCKDPVGMLQGLRDTASERKSILYLCGGCRCLWDLLYDDLSKAAIEVAEQYVDRQATWADFDRARRGAQCATNGDFSPNSWRSFGIYKPTIPAHIQNLLRLGVFTQRQIEEEDRLSIDWARHNHILAAAQLAYATCTRNPMKTGEFLPFLTQVKWPGDWLLRCVFGEPFLPKIELDQNWLTADVFSLAQAIYEDRAFDRMPILGDALEEAGCSEQKILNHCRSETPHVRGCWVVDNLLGKCFRPRDRGKPRP